MSVDSVIESTVGLIPVALAAGVTLKVAEEAMKLPGRKRRSKRSRRSSPGFGDFRNIGL
jgi:hypothetical protein